MTLLITLSIACTAFIVGFVIGLMAFAVAWEFVDASSDEETGAPEGDQLNFNQSVSSSLG